MLHIRLFANPQKSSSITGTAASPSATIPAKVRAAWNSLTQFSHLELVIGFIANGFEVFTSEFAWACCARWVSTWFSVNEPLMAINAACLRTLSPLCVLKHALERKCSWMATPSKRGNGRYSHTFSNHLYLTINYMISRNSEPFQLFSER